MTPPNLTLSNRPTERTIRHRRTTDAERMDEQDFFERHCGRHHLRRLARFLGSS